MSSELHHRYNHPFSLQEAVQFEPGTITSEIARLQNSLQHLASTQSSLEQHLAADPDPDLIQALEENRVVIASQTERIGILRQALDKQGIVSASNAHYDLPSSVSGIAQQTQAFNTAFGAPHATGWSSNDPPQAITGDNEDGGVYL